MDQIENSQFCVTIYVVMPRNATEATCPKDLFLAYECCKENGFNLSWAQEDECMRMKPCKEDVFILHEFVGSLFDHLRQFKCTIIGPQCLLVSVHKGEPLPETPSPVFTVAMKGVVVTTTGCSVAEKKEIQEKVQFMGGTYISAFHGNVTHLIVKSVAEFSPKYKVAISRDVPVMTPSWVDAVWATSVKESVSATDPAFAKYVCPPFQGLVVCVSQIPMKERDALRKIIEANGGHYSGQLEMGKTNILIVTTPEGEKYQYARKWKIRCLKPDWIHQSLSKGYAVEPEKYIVERGSEPLVPARSSTPEPDRSVMRFGNGSINSTIMNESHIATTHINETGCSSTPQQPVPDRSAEAVEALDLAQSKKAGAFLDGCKVFISGFDSNQMEKLRRVLNNAGVSRFNTITESLTHVIAGQRVHEHWKELEKLVHKPHIVTAEWIVQSLRLKRAAPEMTYLHSDYASLIVKKEEVPKKSLAPLSATTEGDANIFQQYLSDQTQHSDAPFAEPPLTGIFSSLTFQFVGLDEDSTQTVSELVVSNGGTLVTAQGAYVVTSATSDEGTFNQAVYDKAIVVNTLWIEDCLDQEGLVEVEFYHEHVGIVDRSRLSGCVVGFSGIQGRMKEFADILISNMSGEPQDTFSRKSLEARGIKKSTHLVCCAPGSQKYEKAIEWGVPTVDPKWLVACATFEERPSEVDYPPGGDALPLRPSSTAGSTAKAAVPTPVTVRRPLSETPVAESVVLKSNNRPRLLDTPTALSPLAAPSMSDTVTPKTVHGRFLSAELAPTPLVGKSPQTRPGIFNMPTPKTPYGRLLNENPSPDTRKIWKEALVNRVKLTPRDEDSFAEAEGEIDPNGEIVIDPEAQCYFENLRKKFRLDTFEAKPTQLADEVARAAAPSRPKKPFEGVVVFFHKKVEEQRSELLRAVQNLGGEYRFQHSQEATHFLYQGKLPNTKEIKCAKEWHQKFVSPQWILDSEDAQIRLEESQYPTSLNPKMTLSSLSFSSQPTPVATQKRRLVATSGPTTPKNLERKRAATDDSVASHSESDEKQVQETSEVHEEVCKELLQLDRAMSRSSEHTEAPPRKIANISAARNGRNATDHAYLPPTQPQPSEGPDSQSVPITWDLHETQHLPAMKPAASAYRIMFSGMDPEDRDKCTVIIEGLGGVVLTSTSYDPTTTHCVAAKIAGNEKLLTSVAAGKWVLHPDWITDSEKEQRFVEEQDYEWGSPVSVVPAPPESVSGDSAAIAAAAHYWRAKRSQGVSEGPFSGITAVLYLRTKNESFARLVEAGCGQVVDECDLGNGKANVCIADAKEIKRLDLADFAQRGIYCVSLQYLRNVVLSVKKKPSLRESVVKEFEPFLDLMP